ncbi:helix-turn-helix transcriptional regulator [Aurantiacibacter poecillastricola]|uniref:helix-turn-helix transcriptional regulator n=1 Tax=Aurantiacibacter poecillastricola TaxID=3064385 RepID=UPI00273E02AC|nr:WYL domain-containing protein [Aurantiacibacter sp. 219JJ12-13]MDP5262372.1 WYL domain-containing protein [Aurantiacibacter sp. 219JJ12-13]
MVEDDKRPWTQTRRFEFIEWKLFWEGALNRSDLEETFEISTPQASVDLRRYRELAGHNIEYDGTSRSFRPTPDIKPSFLKASADRLLIQLRALLTGALPRREVWFRDLPSIDMAPDIARHVDAECLRLILNAIRTKQCVDVRYQSLTNSRTRQIAPHALAFDGYRWHVRAWACDRDDFRDFVLTRIDQIDAGPKADFDPADDLEWNTKITLDLRPHAGLTQEQSLAIERDYAMEDGRREIEVRLSMAYYFIRRMNLDLTDLPPARAQICLQNLSEVLQAIEQARTQARQRIVDRKMRNIDCE